MATNNYLGANNPFIDYLDYDPVATYYSSTGAENFMGGSQGQQRFFRGQYQDAYNDYLGALGRDIRKGTAPDMNFADYLEDYPFTERYAALTPQQAGRTTRQYSPSTRHIYF